MSQSKSSDRGGDDYAVNLDAIRVRIGQTSFTDWTVPGVEGTAVSTHESDGVLAQLRELEQKERILSRRRHELHERIDFLQGVTVKLKPDVVAQLTAFKRSERSCSLGRRRLHHQIDELRAQVRG